MPLCLLPHEILIKIIRSISDLHDPWNRDHQALLHLCQCSRQLYAITQPILYSVWKEKNKTSLLNFLPAILKSPALARCVERIESVDRRTLIDFPTHANDDTSKMIMQILVENKMKTFGNLVDDEGLEFASKWLEAIKAKQWDAITAFALLTFPRLDSVNLKLSGRMNLRPSTNLPLGIQNYDAAPWLIWAFQQAATIQKSSATNADPRAMRSLQTVELIYHPTLVLGEEDTVSRVLTFAALPSVTSFSIAGLRPRAGDDVQMPISLSHVKSLRIEDFRFKGDFLTRFLRYFPALENLRIEHDVDGETKVCIQHLQHSLRELVLLGPYGREPRRLDPHEGAYSHFQKLEFMTVMPQHLNGWVCEAEAGPRQSREDRIKAMVTAIPKSVKSLVLNGCTPRILEMLSDLLDTTWITESKLEYLQLNCNTQNVWWVGCFKDKWESKCELLGIELSVPRYTFISQRQ